jgi:hypothetical protein
VDVQDGVFGYFLDGSSGFTIEEFLLPTHQKRLLPFTLIMRYQLLEKPIERVFFTAESPQAGFKFYLTTDSDGFPRAIIKTADGTVESSVPSSSIAEGKKQELALSFLPDGNNSQFLWFLDGEAVYASEAEIELPILLQEGRTTIAGEEGFTGIVDEVGIYYKDRNDEYSIHSKLYQKKMRELYGDSLVYAEGFDGFKIPDQLETKGEVDIDKGTLIIPPGGSVGLPNFSLAYETVQLEVEIPPDQGGWKMDILDAADGDSFLVYNGDATVLKEQSSDSIEIGSMDDERVLTLSHSERFLTLKGEKNSTTVEQENNESAEVQLVLKNIDKEKSFLLSKVLIIRLNQSFVSSEGEEGIEETLSAEDDSE